MSDHQTVEKNDKKSTISYKDKYLQATNYQPLGKGKISTDYLSYTGRKGKVSRDYPSTAREDVKNTYFLQRGGHPLPLHKR